VRWVAAVLLIASCGGESDGDEFRCLEERTQLVVPFHPEFGEKVVCTDWDFGQ
jgi:hypothetical protein